MAPPDERSFGRALGTAVAWLGGLADGPRGAWRGSELVAWDDFAGSVFWGTSGRMWALPNVHCPPHQHSCSLPFSVNSQDKSFHFVRCAGATSDARVLKTS